MANGDKTAIRNASSLAYTQQK